MRILVYLHSFGPGGVERVALRLAGAWGEADQDVRVLVGRADGPERSMAPENVTYDIARPSPFARPFETLWMIWHLLGAIRRHRPDVIFCAGSTYTIVAAAIRFILGPACPPIVCKLSNSLDRGDLPSFARLGYRIWLRLHRRFIDRFIGLSSAMSKEIMRVAGVPRESLAIIPNPVLSLADIEALSPSVRTERGPGRLFVGIGRLTRQKNFTVLIRAFARICNGNDRLMIIGDGPQRRRLLRLAEKLGIERQVQMPGHLGSVVETLKRADVFVSSSNYEGLPATVVEALAVGLPIVATRSSMCVEHLLGYGEFGQLVPIRDVDALAGALRDAPDRSALSLSELRSIAGQFTIEGSSRLYLDVLAAAAHRRISSQVALEPLRDAA